MTLNDIMLGGRCRTCLRLFEGSSPHCWCSLCHGYFAAAMMKAGISEETARLSRHDWVCPDCGKPCAKSAWHGWECDGKP